MVGVSESKVWSVLNLERSFYCIISMKGKWNSFFEICMHNGESFEMDLLKSSSDDETNTPIG